MKTIYSPPSRKEDEATVNTVDTSKLQNIYPSPKTAYQKAQDTVFMQTHSERRRPAHPAVKSAIATSLLFCVMILLFSNLEQILWSNPLFGVPFWFGVMFGLFVCWRMFLRYILEVFSAYNVSIVPFAVIYSIGFCVISTGIVRGWFGVPGAVQSLGIALGIHAIFVAAIVGFLLRLGYGANGK